MLLRVFFTVAMGLSAAAAAAEPPVSAAPNRGFVVFDALLYKGKPDLQALGMPRMIQVNSPHGVTRQDGVVDDQVRSTLKDWHDYKGAIFLDYEIWWTFHVPEAEVSASIAKLAQTLHLAHQSAPAAQIGYYDIIPCWDYWGIVKNDQAKIQEWQNCNARISELADHVDMVMPSLYTFYNDPQGWDTYAAALLSAARRYHKPVYAFLWPEFHESNRLLKGHNLPGNFWRHELDFCKSRADGVVIWGGWQEQWDENADWWIETKRFLATLNSR